MDKLDVIQTTRMSSRTTLVIPTPYVIANVVRELPHLEEIPHRVRNDRGADDIRGVGIRRGAEF